jgi:anti-anti-sigma regulatory factor/HAMP domain-containing protein
MLRISFGSLRVRLVLLVLAAILPSVAVILYVNAEQRRISTDGVQDSALRVVRLASVDQDRQIEGIRQLLTALAQLPELRSGDPEKCTPLLVKLIKQYPHYTTLGVGKLDGHILCAGIPIAGKNTYIGDRSWFSGAVARRSFAVGDYQIGRTSGKASINFGHPILDEQGQVRYVVYVGLDLGWLKKYAAEVELPDGATLTLVDKQGAILVRYPDDAQQIGKPAFETALAATALANRPDATIEASGPGGTPMLFAFSRLRGADDSGNGHLSVAIPAARAYTTTNRLLAVNLGALGAATLLALVAAWLGGNVLILRDINNLVKATQRVSAGDLSVSVSASGTELGMLASSFNHMVSEVEAARGNLEAQVEERTRALQTALSDVEARAAEQARLLAENEARAAEQARLLAENEQQRARMRAMSVPVLPVNETTLVVPLVGALDAERLSDLQHQALNALEQSRAEHLLLDVTGVPVIDAPVAHGLLRVAGAARLLGSSVVLVGISPAVAQSLVGLSVDLSGIETKSTLRAGLAHVLSTKASRDIRRS